mmetsp:Transcript_46832/g.85780  ORF Transcript_46832/g.85780 Transcript_46832/m.85780 type:complete len:764 (-) Transcript_46832:47-2338(-)
MRPSLRSSSRSDLPGLASHQMGSWKTTDGTRSSGVRSTVSRNFERPMGKENSTGMQRGATATALPIAPDPALGHDTHAIERDHAVFPNTDDLKAKVRQNITKHKYNVRDRYKEGGIWKEIATNQYFEAVTLLVIFCNAIWIWIDTDLNKSEFLLEADPIFQVAEQFFCFFFSFEWFVRFMAFKYKSDCLKDAWFIFDSLLVLMMVAETWVMSVFTLATGVNSGGGGDASVLRIARLLRLTRMARMARLLRAMPEIMILIKGMLQASRSVIFTLLLLLMLMYVFAIAMTQLLDGTRIGRRSYSSVLHSMGSLWIHGALLDEVNWMTKRLSKESFACTALFTIFVLLAALTVLNLLVGVLCEVVGAVAATEKEEMLCGWVNEKLKSVVSALDTDGDNQISKDEFLQMLTMPDVCRCLYEVGVDVVGLVDSADAIFQGAGFSSNDSDEDDVNIDFAEFMQTVLQLRGQNVATVKDVVELRKFIRDGIGQMQSRLHAVSEELQRVYKGQNHMQSSFSSGLSIEQFPTNLTKGLSTSPSLSQDSQPRLFERPSHATSTDRSSSRPSGPKLPSSHKQALHQAHDEGVSALDLRGTWTPWDPPKAIVAHGSQAAADHEGGEGADSPRAGGLRTSSKSSSIHRRVSIEIPADSNNADINRTGSDIHRSSSRASKENGTSLSPAALRQRVVDLDTSPTGSQADTPGSYVQWDVGPGPPQRRSTSPTALSPPNRQLEPSLDERGETHIDLSDVITKYLSDEAVPKAEIVEFGI